MPIINDESMGNRGLLHADRGSPNVKLAYLSMMLLFAASLVSLPFIYIDTAISGSGIIRPELERASIRTAVSGMISAVCAAEGGFVAKNATLFILDDSVLLNKKEAVEQNIRYRTELAADLQFLLKDTVHRNPDSQIRSPVYRQQARQYASQRMEWTIQLQKSSRELLLNKRLAEDNIITPVAFFEKQLEHQRVLAGLSVFEKAQSGKWEEELANQLEQIRQLRSDLRQIKEEQKIYRIRSPVAGIVQYIHDKYPGAAVAAGETLCMVSPESELIAECWVNSRDMGLLQTNQPAVFRIDAFNFGYSILPGRILSIDNDYTIRDGQPMFGIRCLLNSRHIALKNGFRGELKKGMGLTVRFLTRRRSLWQLLYDRAEDWLYPLAAVNDKT